MKKQFIIFLSFLLISISSYARKDRSSKRGEHFKRIMSQLDLSKEQMAKLKKFRQESKDSMKSNRQEMRSLREKIKTGFIQQLPDSELEKMHQQMNSLHKKFADFKFRKIIFLKNILNQKQREKFMSLRRQSRKR